MTKAEFDTVEVGDLLLARNGRHMHVTDVDRANEEFSFTWKADIAHHGDVGGSDSNHYSNFAYQTYILKGVRYGTHRTLRHKADFKAKP